VVDIGCGQDRSAPSCQHGRCVVGLDLSGAMAALAHARLDAAVVADLRRLPFGSGQLGGLVAFYLA
jgi:predicted TPR repeat methyltransferase